MYMCTCTSISRGAFRDDRPLLRSDIGFYPGIIVKTV